MTRSVISDDKIREIFIANGFTIKEGLDDLKPYVYAAAHALINEVLSVDDGCRKAVGMCLTEQAHGGFVPPFGYLRQTNSKDNPPHGWAFHFIGMPGDVAVYVRSAPATVQAHPEQANSGDLSFRDVLAAWRTGATIQYFVRSGYDSDWTDYIAQSAPNEQPTRLMWRVKPEGTDTTSSLSVDHVLWRDMTDGVDK